MRTGNFIAKMHLLCAEEIISEGTAPVVRNRVYTTTYYVV